MASKVASPPSLIIDHHQQQQPGTSPRRKSSKDTQSRSEMVRKLMKTPELVHDQPHPVVSAYVDPKKYATTGRRKGNGVVANMVNRMEQKTGTLSLKAFFGRSLSTNDGDARKPPLATDETLENDLATVEKKGKEKKRYTGNLTSTNILHSIFGREKEAKEEKKTSKLLAIYGPASKETKVIREGDDVSIGKRLKRTMTDATNLCSGTFPLGGGPLKKRLSEGASAVLNTSLQQLKKNSKRIAVVADADNLINGLVKLRKTEEEVKVAAKKKKKKTKAPVVATTVATKPDRPSPVPVPSLIVSRKLTPPSTSSSSAPSATTVIAAPPKDTLEVPGTQRKRPLTVSGGSLMRSERRVLGRGCSRSVTRSLTLAPARTKLPPLYENADGDVESGEMTERRRMRRYGGSHTTSTYQGEKDTAPDASARRHLIGFLHRTSHLSLTSELSANASFYLVGHRRHMEESTLGSESDARMFSDDDDRGSTTTDFTSVSRQHEKMMRKRRSRRNFRRPSRASSFSSITESSMSLDVITVTLNMDTVNFLGISIVGQTSTRGDSGIYVANIMKGGAVALDGRIEAGDMILQVNDISFENFTNDQAVDVLRDAVSRRGPIRLTVAKCFENGPKSCFTMPRNSREEPVRPIDTHAWIQHTNAMRGMPSILEGSEGAPTPIPGDWPGGRPASSSTATSTNSNGQNTVVGGGGAAGIAGQHIRLDVSTDKKKVVSVMAMPSSGLDIKNRTWLKIPIPMSFLGSDLVEWLLDHVEGLRDRKDARKYAAELLRLKLIAHVVNKITFTEQCYYVLGDECADFARFRNEDGQPKYQWTTGSAAGGPVPSSMYGGSKMSNGPPIPMNQPPMAPSMMSASFQL